MQVHVLNGDALAEKFPVPGKVIICRECLLDGPVLANSLEDFFNQRANYLSATYDPNCNYEADVEAEFQKLLSINPEDEINLWFEHDLFCQANMWFVLHWILSNRLNNTIFRISPVNPEDKIWDGFGDVQSSDLHRALEERVRFTREDLGLASRLWNAFAQKNFEELKTLSITKSNAFPFLAEICDAEIQRSPQVGLGRPALKLLELKQSGLKTFQEVFSEFKKTEAIYGFGDLQVRNMLSTLKDN